MHTHFHLLAWVENTKQVAPLMKAINISYHHYYHRKYKYCGHLWHSRYRSIIINNESQWLQCGRYIELNPVHAGLCNDPKNFPWSSYHYHAYGKNDYLIRTDMPLLGTFKRQAGLENHAYQEFIKAGIDIDYQRLKNEFEKEKFY